MSQYPPPPPPGFPPPPPGQNYPPSNYPPHGQAYGYPPQPRGANGLSITALILGILLCIPVITGLGAIIFGFAGSHKARDPRFGGRGMAVTGIILGVLNLIGWGLFGGLGYAYYQRELKPAKQMAHDFIDAMSQGKVNTAAGYSHSTFAQAALQRASDQMQPWGKLKDTSFTEFKTHYDSSGERMDLAGTAVFEKTTKRVNVSLKKEAGQWKIVEFNFPP